MKCINYWDKNELRFQPFLTIRDVVIMAVMIFANILPAQPLDFLKAELDHKNLDLHALRQEYRAAVFISEQPAPQLSKSRELANTRKKLFLASIAARRLDLIYDLETAYFQLAGLDKCREIQAKSLDVYAGLEQMARTKAENSKGRSVDVYRLQLQSQTVTRDLEDLRFAAQLQMVKINKLLNREVDTQIAVELDADNRLNLILDNAPDLANDDPDLSAHPRFVAIELHQEAGQQARDIRRESLKLDFRAKMKNALLIMESAASQLYLVKEQLVTLENILELIRAEYLNSTHSIDDLLKFEQQKTMLNVQASMAKTTILQQQAAIDRYFVTQ